MNTTEENVLLNRRNNTEQLFKEKREQKENDTWNVNDPFSLAHSPILLLPLMQGLSKKDFLQMVSKVKFDFRKVNTKKPFLRQGQTSTSLVFLLKGELESEQTSADDSYLIREYVHAPAVIEPEVLFGLRTAYTRTYRNTSGEVSLLYIEKNAVRGMMLESSIFRINYLNMLSRLSQRKNDLLWRDVPQSIEARIVRFLLNRVAYPAGKKVLKIKMERLSEELYTTRINVSMALRRMQEAGWLISSRNFITIPALEKLLSV